MTALLPLLRRFWPHIAAAFAIAVLWAMLNSARQQVADLRDWQVEVIDTATAAYGTPGKDGKIKRYRPDDVSVLIMASAHNLASAKASIAAQNASLRRADTAAKAAQDQAKSAAAAFDKAQRRQAQALRNLQNTPPPASPETDAVEALEIGREQWSELR